VPPAFPAQSLRQQIDDYLTRSLARALERVAAGPVTPTLDMEARATRAWVSLARFEERDVIRICVTHGETSGADLAILIEALQTSA